jgi:hypothetical protein
LIALKNRNYILAGAVIVAIELDTPTIALMVPKKNKRRSSFSPDEPSESSGYIRLNIPQLARLGLFSRSTQGCGSEVLSLHNIRFTFGKGCDCASYVWRN